MEDITKALDRLQSTADNLIAFETSRRIQLGREKEARMVEAYQYLLENENDKIEEIELVLDSINRSLESRGMERIKLGDEQKTINFDAIIAAASESGTAIASAMLEDRKTYRDSLQDKKVEAQSLARHINIYEDALALINPAVAKNGLDHVVEAEEVVAAVKHLEKDNKDFLEETEKYIKFRQTPEQLALSGEDWFAHQKQLAEQDVIAASSTSAGNLSAIERLEIVRQQYLEVLKTRIQDPVMALGRHYAPIGALKAAIADETVPSKEKELEAQLLQAHTDLGGMLYPQLMDENNKWTTPTDIIHADLADKLSSSLLLVEQGNPTQFISYLEHVQEYYNMMKDDKSDTGRAVVNRIRQETIQLLGVDLEALIQFGGKQLSELEIIMLANHEIERIDLEQMFHGMEIDGSIKPNISFDAQYPDNKDNLDHDEFMRSKRK
tara:strand:- start:13049 stop:14365 length:1317 start_codon:yes stop_codon:yes gene_type:complete